VYRQIYLVGFMVYERSGCRAMIYPVNLQFHQLSIYTQMIMICQFVIRYSALDFIVI